MAGEESLITGEVRIVVDGQKLADMVRSPDGDVVHDLIRRGQLVMNAAKKQVRMGHIRAGMGDVGGGARQNLRDTIHSRTDFSEAWPKQVVGSELAPLALIHHEGTQPHVITPRVARVLRFFPGGQAPAVFRLSVNHPGTRPNRYLTDNLHLAADGSSH